MMNNIRASEVDEGMKLAVSAIVQHLTTESAEHNDESKLNVKSSFRCASDLHSSRPSIPSMHYTETSLIMHLHKIYFSIFFLPDNGLTRVSLANIAAKSFEAFV